MEDSGRDSALVSGSRALVKSQPSTAAFAQVATRAWKALPVRAAMETTERHDDPGGGEGGEADAGKGPSDPGPESFPSEKDAEKDLPGVPDEAEDRPAADG